MLDIPNTTREIYDEKYNILWMLELVSRTDESSKPFTVFKPTT